MTVYWLKVSLSTSLYTSKDVKLAVKEEPDYDDIFDQLETDIKKKFKREFCKNFDFPDLRIVYKEVSKLYDEEETAVEDGDGITFLLEKHGDHLATLRLIIDVSDYEEGSFSTSYLNRVQKQSSLTSSSSSSLSRLTTPTSPISMMSSVAVIPLPTEEPMPVGTGVSAAVAIAHLGESSVVTPTPRRPYGDGSWSIVPPISPSRDDSCVVISEDAEMTEDPILAEIQGDQTSVSPSEFLADSHGSIFNPHESIGQSDEFQNVSDPMKRSEEYHQDNRLLGINQVDEFNSLSDQEEKTNPESKDDVGCEPKRLKLEKFEDFTEFMSDPPVSDPPVHSSSDDTKTVDGDETETDDAGTVKKQDEADFLLDSESNGPKEDEVHLPSVHGHGGDNKTVGGDGNETDDPGAVKKQDQADSESKEESESKRPRLDLDDEVHSLGDPPVHETGTENPGTGLPGLQGFKRPLDNPSLTEGPPEEHPDRKESTFNKMLGYGKELYSQIAANSGSKEQRPMKTVKVQFVFHLWKQYREITLVYRCEPRNVDPSYYETYGYRRRDDWQGKVLEEPVVFGDGYICKGEIEVPIGESKVVYHLQTYQLNATGSVQTLPEDTYLIGYGGPEYGNRVQREFIIYRHFKCDQELLVYGVSRFNRSESQRSVIDQYTALLHLIISQNPNVDELWKQFNHFERNTMSDKKTNVLKLFKEGMESTVIPTFTRNPDVGNQILILKLLSKFERRVKGGQKPNTLPTIAIKRCGKFLLSLGESEALSKSDIRSDVKRMVRNLIDEHKEDSPHFLILYFKLKKHYEMLKKEMKELDDHGSDDDDEYDFFDDEMDDFPGFHNFDRRGGRELMHMHMMGPGPRRRQHIGRLINFHMNEAYLNEVIPYFGEFPELLKLCIDKANLPGLACLVKKGVAVKLSDIVNPGRKNEFSHIKENYAKTVTDFIAKKFDQEDVTEALYAILKALSDKLRELESTRTLADALNRSSPLEATRLVFEKLWEYHLYSCIVWSKTSDNTLWRVLHYQNLEWWIGVFKRLNTSGIKQRDEDAAENFKDANEKAFLRDFENYLRSIKDDKKKTVVTDKNFLKDFPPRIKNVTILVFQDFIINYLKKNKSTIWTTLTSSGTRDGFVRAVNEILKIRFKTQGVLYKHLLVTKEKSSDYFPWEEIIGMDEFKKNQQVKDAKELLMDGFKKLCNGSLTLRVFKSLYNDEDYKINKRFEGLTCIALSTVKKNPQPAAIIKARFKTKEEEYEYFLMILECCRLLLQKYGEKTGKNWVCRELHFDGHLNDKQIKDIWESCPNDHYRICSVMPHGCLEDLTSDQIDNLKYLKHIGESKLFQHYLNQFLDASQYNPDQNIVTFLVGKIFDPAFAKLNKTCESFVDATITQKAAKSLFEELKMSYIKDDEIECFKKDLQSVSNNLNSNICQENFKKLEILLCDLKGAFECLQKVKETLGLKEKWRKVEELRKNVFKEEFEENLQSIDASLDLEFFKKISHTRKFIDGFASSQKLVEWIRVIAGGEAELTTFIDLATTNEDPAVTERLAGLRHVVFSIRPLIFGVKVNSTFEEFEEAFGKMYESVQSHNDICEKLNDVTEHLDWFKELQDLQTDTTKSTLAQVENLKTKGVFRVGCSDERERLEDFFTERKTEELIEARFVTEKNGEVRRYSYRELRELNDKLVLICSEQNYQQKASSFIEVFSKLIQICEVFKSLNECGHESYQSWIMEYESRDTDMVKKMETEYGEMQEELKEMKEKTNKEIKLYKPLTNYTQLQLLFLRIKLPYISSNKHQTSPFNDNQIRVLLRAVNPDVELPEAKQRMKEMELKKRQMLTLEQLGKLLERLEKRAMGKTVPDIKRGDISLLKVPVNDVLRHIISVFAQTDRPPRPEEILCCTSDTTEEQLSVFLHHTILYNDEKQINCLVTPEYLSYQLNKYFIEEYQRLKDDIPSNRAKHFSLVIVTDQLQASLISSTFIQHAKKFPPAADAVLKKYVEEIILTNDACDCDPTKFSGRLISSVTSGNGKTKFVSDIVDNHSQTYTIKCVPIHKRNCDRNVIVKEFLKSFDQHATDNKSFSQTKVVYLVDVSPSVRTGADILIFELLILRRVCDGFGRIFRPFSGDCVMIEGLFSDHNFCRNFPAEFVPFLPIIECLSPLETVEKYERHETPARHQMLLEDSVFVTERWQRVYQYLSNFKEMEENQFKFEAGTRAFLKRYKNDTGEIKITYNHKKDLINCFLRFINIANPSWREIDNFVSFLDTQLRCYEQCAFTGIPELGIIFDSFVVKFMVKMSGEFATRSLQISEGGDVLFNHQLQKRWNKTFHPYLFFNKNDNTYTFIGFKIQPPGHLMDIVTNEIKETNFMTQDLLGRLKVQKITFKESLKDYTTEFLMDKIRRVLQLKTLVQPDKDYQLTLDNTIKILAIHMRMRSNIPVVIMGETGCGKTRLIQFMCDIVKQDVLNQFEPDQAPLNIENLITLRVHGGITTKKIEEVIERAEEKAAENQNFGLDTLVFFDEANATSEIDLIREIMCNHKINGRRINSTIRFIAAVNPYRKHSPEMIDQLKKAGLGYRTGDSEIEDKIGDIPLRELVYRVHPLPPSLKPLVWDFGTMDNETEHKYVDLIVRSRLSDESISSNYLTSLIAVISGCQNTLRTRSDQCSFVSLRDVNRFIDVFKWFLDKAEVFSEVAESQNHENNPFNPKGYPVAMLSTINALGVAYYVRINEGRHVFMDEVAKSFKAPFSVVTGGDLIETFEGSQTVLLYEMLDNCGVKLNENPARNRALKENVFMMVVCVQLKIPLFIVGHPGSSKSFAKHILKTCLSKDQSKSQLFKKLKEIHMVSFQCSPLSEAEGIEQAFTTAGSFLSEDILPVVVLDEIGLAEDSKKMPLKALHSLLEDNGRGSDTTRIGFIGISNWALDPAKMNRGLYVTRHIPDTAELIYTAKQICQSGDGFTMSATLSEQLEKVTAVYTEIYDKFTKTESSSSYIGLRDFYCLVKKLFDEARRKEVEMDDGDILRAILRNFGGIEKTANDMILEIFIKHFNKIRNEDRPEVINMIKDNIRAETLNGGNRYLLIVSPTLETTIDTIDTELRKFYKEKNRTDVPAIKFNSNFPDDADYTKRCKVINDVKNLIEKGQAILLIDMEMIYESLYDVLNQLYKEWQNKKFVEIGLESLRVNCRVDDKTKIILLTTPENAAKFPIPLLNRMEKHYFTLKDSMGLTENNMVEKIEEWVNSLTQSNDDLLSNFKTNETFTGYHADTVASIVKSEFGNTNSFSEKSIKKKLLRSVTYDGIVRMSKSRADNGVKEFVRATYSQSGLKTFEGFVKFEQDLKTKSKRAAIKNYIVTTFSHIPAKSSVDKKIKDTALIYNVEEFGSQQKFEEAVRPFFTDNSKWLILLIPYTWQKLLSFIRYHLQSQTSKTGSEDDNKTIVIVTQLIRNVKESPPLFCSEVWDIIHVDDLELESINSSDLADIDKIWNRSIPDLFRDHVLTIGGVLSLYRNQVMCNLVNPFPHDSVKTVIKNILESGRVKDRIDRGLQESMGTSPDWIEQLAMNRTKLSQTTSFKNVLLTKIAGKLTTLAASVIADIDRDGNVALRTRELEGLWDSLLKLLPDTKCCLPADTCSDSLTFGAPAIKVSHTFLSTAIPVQRRFPFSWIVKKALDDIRSGVEKLNKQDMVETYSEEFGETRPGLYQILRTAEGGARLSQDYLFDYVNMVYEAKTRGEIELAVSVFSEVVAPSLESVNIAECAIRVHLHYCGPGARYLEALKRTLKVYYQVFEDNGPSVSDLAELTHRFYNVDGSPLYRVFISILNTIVDKGAEDCIMSFNEPFKLILSLYEDQTGIQTIMRNEWNKVKLNNLCEIYINKLLYTIQLFRPDSDLRYVEDFRNDIREIKTVEDSIDKIVGFIYKMLDKIHPVMFDMWRCSYAFCPGQLSEDDKKENKYRWVPIDNQVVTTCRHVFCRGCYHDLTMQNGSRCPQCEAQLHVDTLPLSEDICVLARKVEQGCEEAVSLIGQVIVTFLKEYSISENTAQTLAMLGKGRIKGRNQLFYPVSDNKLDSLETLIFTMLIKNLLKSRSGDQAERADMFVKHIRNVIYNEQNERSLRILNKFVIIYQDQINKEDLDGTGILQMADGYLRMFTEVPPDSDRIIIRQILAIIPELRLKLILRAADILDIIDGRDRLTEEFRDLGELFSTAPEQFYTLRLFLLKQLFKKRGASVLQKIVADPELSWLCPVEDPGSDSSDLHMLLGEDYVSLRNELVGGEHLGEIQRLVLESSPIDVILALHNVRKANTLRNEVLEVIKNNFEGSEDDIADKERAREFLLTLCNPKEFPTTLGALNVETMPDQAAPLSLLYLAVASRSKYPFLRVLETLMLSPERTGTLFLPGMRDDTIADIIRSQNENGNQFKWYKCRNGHSYAINNCGRPMQQATCICGEVIGGQNHQFAVGANGAQVDLNALTTFDVKGYNLLGAGERALTDTERKLSPLLLNLIRWCTHAAFIFSAKARNYQQQIFKKNIPDFTGFLEENLRADFRGISQHLNRGPDDTVIFLVLVIKNFLVSEVTTSFICDDVQTRDKVEDIVIRTVQPLVEPRSTAIRDAQQALLSDLNLAANPLIKQIYEFEDPPPGLSSPDLHSHISLWKNSQHTNLDMFCMFFKNVLQSDDQDSYPLVKAFIEIRDKLHILKYLPKIIEFHRRLVTIYSYKIRFEEAQKIEIGDVIRENPDLRDGFKYWTEAWSVLREVKSTYAIPDTYSSMDYIPDTAPLSLFLASVPTLTERGPQQREGACGLHLIESLVNLHNTLAGTRKEVSLFDKFVEIVYDKESAELYTLFALSVEIKDNHKIITFSYSTFEQYLSEEMLSGVRRISNSRANFSSDTLCMTYREDIVWLKQICFKLHEKEPQRRLEKNDTFKFGELESQACSNVKNAIGVAMAYIRSGLGVKADDSTPEPLITFMRRIECIPPSHLRDVTQKLPGDILKCHVLDIWYMAYFYESLWMVDNPFSDVMGDNAEDLPNELKGWVKDLKKTELFRLMSELHRVIIDWVIYESEKVDYSEMPLEEALDFYEDAYILGIKYANGVFEDELDLPDILPDIIFKHLPQLWLELRKCYIENRNRN